MGKETLYNKKSKLELIKLLKEEKNDLKEAPTKKMKIIPLTSIEKGEETSHALNLSKPNEPSVVKAPHLNAKEKKLVNEFTRLFKERKEIKNKGKLSYLRCPVECPA